MIVICGMLLEMEGFTNHIGNLLNGKYGQAERGRAKYMIISGDQELSSYINYIKNEAKNKDDGIKKDLILEVKVPLKGLILNISVRVHILDPTHLNKNRAGGEEVYAIVHATYHLHKEM